MKMNASRCAMIISCNILFILLFSIIPISLAADEGIHSRPKIGLVLSGGGARGAAHIGILRILEELNVPVDYIAGTSMGAVIGGLYASGMSLDELEKIATQTDWAGVFSDTISRRDSFYWKKTNPRNYLTDIEIDFKTGVKLPQGVITGKRLDLLLRSMTLGASDDFDDFPIPFRAVASDIETGEMIVLSHGDLARSLRASMAIPGAFSPVKIDGRLLVDGGVAQNLPISVVKNMGADIVIAVDIGTPLFKRRELKNFLSIINQITGILTTRNVQLELEKLKPEDIYIKPNLEDITTASFDRMDKAIVIGQKAAQEQQARLSVLGLSKSNYDIIRDEQLSRIKTIEKIDFIRCEQKSLLGSQLILNLIERSTKGVLNKDILAYDMFDFYKRGDFEDLDFKLQEINGKQGIIIKQKPRNPFSQKVTLGIQLYSNFDMDNSLELLTKYTLSNINRLNAQFKNELLLGDHTSIYSEFHQPLNPYPWHVFLAPNAEYNQMPIELYQSRKKSSPIAEYKFYEAYARLDLGLQMAQYGELRVGYQKGKTKTTVKIGPDLPENTYDNGGVRIKLDLDQLENVYFPKNGWQLTSTLTYGKKQFGSDENYRQADISILKAFSYFRHTLLFKAKAGSNFDTTNFLARGYFLGGPFNLSGLNEGQYYGGHMAMAEAIYYFNVKSLSKLLKSDFYTGISFESGNIWDNRSDINSSDLILSGSLFLGFDTPLGAFFIGYGRAQGNCQTGYISLGVKYF